MIALEILNEINEQINRSSVYGYSVEIHFNKAYQTRIERAIEELEELKNRSCSTCRYGRSFHFDEDIECMKLYDATQGLCFEKDFYCKNWEPK